MSLALGESPRSSDQLYSPPEVPQPSSPSASPSPDPMPVRDMTNIQRNDSHNVRGSGNHGNKQLLAHRHGAQDFLCHRGDKQCALEMVNCHGNRDHLCGDERRADDVEVEQSREGEASRLRQQWARQTKCIPLSSAEEVDVSPGGKVEEGRQEEHILPDSNIGQQPSCPNHHLSSPDTATPPAHTRQSRQLLKSQSVGSISSESLTISSLWEAPSYDTIPDFLSSLGFDDFDSPELIPDRFIPPELNFVRPSLMRQATLGSVDSDSPPSDSFPLGATADTVNQSEVDPPLPPQTLALYLPSNSQLPWQPASLETVVEETGSELLSPRPSSRLSARLTPRLTSPLLSIEHTPTQDLPAGLDGDVSAGLLGAGLAQRLRLTKEDLRQRQMSLGADSDTSSIYFSVGSHFEETEKEVETGSGGRERGGRDGGGGGSEGGGVREASIEEVDSSSRRRRRGNYAPPPQLLMWLEKADSAAHIADQPWPFSESSSPAPPDPLPPPTITLNDNSNNNSVVVCKQRLQLAVINSAPQDSVSMQGQLIGDHTKLQSSLTSVYHQTSHTPT